MTFPAATSRAANRSSRSRGKLFYRLVEQAVAADPVPTKILIGGMPPVER